MVTWVSPAWCLISITHLITYPPPKKINILTPKNLHRSTLCMQYCFSVLMLFLSCVARKVIGPLPLIVNIKAWNQSATFFPFSFLLHYYCAFLSVLSDLVFSFPTLAYFSILDYLIWHGLWIKRCFTLHLLLSQNKVGKELCKYWMKISNSIEPNHIQMIIFFLISK